MLLPFGHGEAPGPEGQGAVGLVGGFDRLMRLLGEFPVIAPALGVAGVAVPVGRVDAEHRREDRG